MVRRWLVVTMLAGAGTLVGCGESEPLPPYNYNMGSEPGELMPTPPQAVDLGILEERIAVRPAPAGLPVVSEDAETPPEEPAEP